MANKNPSKTPRNWPALLVQHGQSGQSAADFCRAQGLNLSTFYTARWSLRKKYLKPAAQATFAPVRVVHTPASKSTLELVLRNDRILRFPESILPLRLAELAEALEARPC
jgi:hypothetical protein